MSKHDAMEPASLGDLAFESKIRATDVPETGLRVYGVDRTDGLTPDAKYTSKELSRYKVLRPGMFAYNPMRLNIGSIAHCTDNHAVGLVSPDYVVFSCKPDALAPEFLAYAIKGPEWRQWTTAAGVGSVRVRIYFRELAKMPLTVPPLAEQKAIAAVLGALDDKIELNRRMNATLEAMARSLFQSWFVDFDPVCAKLDGRKPTGLDEATAALFPATFQDSPLGPIPHGWEVKTLSELTALITKGTTPTQEDMTSAPDTDAQINYVRVNSIDEDGSVLPEKLTTIPESVHAGILKRSILKANDVLYTIAGTIGRIALAEDWILPANANQAIAIIRPALPIPSGFLILTMQHDAFREELHNNIVHAVQANLSLGMLSKARAIVPPEPTLQRLFVPIDDILSKVSANRAQSRTLATLRDALLPQLLSGKLRVKDDKPINAMKGSACG